MENYGLPDRPGRIDSRRISQATHFQPRRNPMQQMKSLSLHTGSCGQPGNQGVADQFDDGRGSLDRLNDDIPLIWPVLRKIAANQSPGRCPEAARPGVPDRDSDLAGEAVYRWKMIHIVQEQLRLLGCHFDARMAGPDKNLFLRNLDRKGII